MEHMGTMAHMEKNITHNKLYFLIQKGFHGIRLFVYKKTF